MTKIELQSGRVVGGCKRANQRQLNIGSSFPNTVQSQLGNLDRLSTNGVRSKGGDARGPVAPKYRNPANPAETWAGRGLKPRWLAAALKSGKKLEDFSIAALGKKIQVPKKTVRK